MNIRSLFFPEPARHPQTASSSESILFEESASCGRIVVKETFFRGHRARLLLVDGAMESAMALEEGCEHLLLFFYLREFDWAFRLHPGIRDTLLIGGGGFAWPRHFFHDHPDGFLDTVEISREMIDISRRFFRLNELEEAAEGRFRVFETDGVSYLLGCRKQYDLILCDAFTGKAADRSLFSDDGIILLKAHLTAGGICICNIITSVSGFHSRSGRALKSRFGMQFRHTMLLQADDSIPPSERQNCLLIASDSELW